jgi:ureidoglycolate hydrolase
LQDISYITKENFEKYGTVIEFTGKEDNPAFEVIITDENDPWRIALLRVEEREFICLEKHPNSMETFEPLDGICLLLLSLATSRNDYRYFVLDRPVCLHRGVWHGIVSLTEASKVKITENFEVDTEYYELDKPIRVLVD